MLVTLGHRPRKNMKCGFLLQYSGDKLRCRRSLCPELHNYLLEVDQTAKRANVAGWLFFEKAERGWR